MYKILIFFLIFISSELFSQSWELLYQEDILQYDYINESYGVLQINDIIIKGDSTIVLRFWSDTLLMIYDQKIKQWLHILKKDFWKCLKNDSLYNIYKDSDILNLFYDSKSNLWFSSQDSIFNVTPDTTYIISQIYVRDSNAYTYIYNSNRTIYNIKEDNNGGIWMFLHTRFKIKDSVYSKEYRILCKYTNNRFETVFITADYFEFLSLCNFVFDNLNRVWLVNGDTCYIIKDEKLEKKFTTWDFPDGYGYFSDLAIDSRNVFYATNHNMQILRFDGENFSSDNYIRDIERIITPGIDLYLYWMRRDSSDNIWITGFKTPYLYKLDTKGVWTRFDVPKFATASDNWRYKALLEIQKDGKLWSAGYNGAGYSYGFYIFDPEGSTGVEDQINSNFQIYPNPASEYITLSNSENQKISSITILNYLGIEVKRINTAEVYANLNYTISTTDLPVGLYHCCIENNTFKQNKNFIIIR